jgi:hypothetical protein
MYIINKHTETMNNIREYYEYYDFNKHNNHIYISNNKSYLYYDDIDDKRIPLIYKARYINGNPTGISIRKFI